MPIYEYRCQSCSLVFEKIVFGSAPPPPCPACASDEVAREPSSFGIGGSTKGGGSKSSCGGCRRTSCAGCH